jgi:hypothetical protein
MVPGTSAKLVKGDKLTIFELLYGMMLPSGNDAALSVADYFGRILLNLKPKESCSPESTTTAGTSSTTMTSNSSPMSEC